MGNSRLLESGTSPNLHQRIRKASFRSRLNARRGSYARTPHEAEVATAEYDSHDTAISGKNWLSFYYGYIYKLSEDLP